MEGPSDQSKHSVGALRGLFALVGGSKGVVNLDIDVSHKLGLLEIDARHGVVGLWVVPAHVTVMSTSDRNQ